LVLTVCYIFGVLLINFFPHSGLTVEIVQNALFWLGFIYLFLAAALAIWNLVQLSLSLIHNKQSKS
jgi:hypothetical protein